MLYSRVICEREHVNMSDDHFEEEAKFCSKFVGNVVLPKLQASEKQVVYECRLTASI